MEHEVEGSRPRGRPKKTWKEVVREDCQGRKLNKEDATDRCKWRKVIKEAQWSGWVWVGECFFWYRPTRVVPDQRPLIGRCCCYCCSVGWAGLTPPNSSHHMNSFCAMHLFRITAFHWWCWFWETFELNIPSKTKRIKFFYNCTGVLNYWKLCDEQIYLILYVMLLTKTYWKWLVFDSFQLRSSNGNQKP